MVVLPVLVFVGVLVHRIDADTRSRTEAALRAGAGSALAAVDRLLGEQLAGLGAMAGSTALDRGDLSGFHAEAERALAARRDWLTVRLADARTGTVLMDLARPEDVGRVGRLDPEGFDAVLDAGGALVGGVRRDPRFGEPLVVLRVAVVRDGRIRYVLSAAVRAGAFSQVIGDLGIPASWTVAVLDRGRRIVGRTENAERYVGAVATPSLAREIERGSNGLFFAQNQEGERVYTAFRISSTYGWTAAVGAPARIVEAPRRRDMALAGVGSVLALGLAGLISAVLARSMAARQRAERRMVAERRLSDVAANFPGLIYRRVLHPDGTVTYPYVSPGVHDLFGFGMEQVARAQSLGEIARRVVHPEDAARWEATLAASAARLEPYEIEVRVRHPDGRPRWMRSAARVARAPDGSIVWDGVVTDLTDLKQAERALRESEERLRLATEAARFGTWDADLVGGRTVLSQRMREIYGWRVGEPITHGRFLDSILPEDRPGVEAAIARACDPAGSGAYEAEFRLRQPDGAVRWLSSRGQVFFGEAGGERRAVRFLGASVDVTDLKRTEAALRESEERFRTMADQSPLMIWVDDADGSCTYVNRSWQEFTGQSFEEALGSGWLACIHPGDRARVEAVAERAKTTQAPFRTEYRLLRRDGGYGWAIDVGAPRFGSDGAFLGYVGSVMDISDQKEMQQHLQASQERFRFAIEAAQAGAWEYDFRRDVAVWSESNFALFGLDPSGPAPGHRAWLQAAVHPDDRARIDAAIADALERRQTEFRVEYRIRHPVHGVRWITGQGRVTYAADGTPLRMSGLSLDVTARRLGEEERERLTADLERERALLRAIVDNLPAGVSVAEAPSGRSLLHNAETVRLLGHPMDQGAEFREIHAGYGAVHADGTPYRPEEYPTVRAVVHGEAVEGEEMRYRRGDGRMTVLSVSSRPVRDATGRIALAVTTLHDIAARKAMEEELRASRESLRLSLTLAGIGTWDADLATGDSVWSRRLRDIYGFSPDEEITHEKFLARIHPEDRPALDAAVARATDPAGSGEYAIDFRVVRPDGAVRWVLARGIYLFAEVAGARRAVRLIGSTLDVTQMKERELALQALLDEKDTLLREVHHRVKNNLQVVLTLLQFEAASIRGGSDPAERIEAVGRRIHAMAELHEQLYASENLARVDLGRYLAALADHVAGIHAGQPIAIRVEADPVLADPEAAVPLGLLTNELVTNALKHAFPDGRAGTIRIALRRAAGGGLALTVADDGVGSPADGEAPTGIGHLLVEALVSQLGATLRIDADGGTRTTISIPDPERLGLARREGTAAPAEEEPVRDLA